jgi:hypothetical protein
MPDAALDRAFDQRARIGRIVEIIAERIAHRIRHDDLGGEMGDRFDPALLDDARHEFSVAEIADDQLHAFRHGPGVAGREIVNDDARSPR